MTGKKFFFIAAITLSLLGTIGLMGSVEQQAIMKNIPGFVKDRVVIKLSGDDLFHARPAMTEKTRIGRNIERQIPVSDALTAKYRGEVKSVTRHDATGYYILETVSGCDIRRLCRKLKDDPGVEDASPDYYAAVTEAVTAPNDPFFQYQYGLNNTGQIYVPDLGLTGTAGSDMRALQGWSWSTGSDSVIIAVIDTGVASNHEDLQGKIVPGYNAVADNFDPYDDNGHGTLSASIAAAETGNNLGIAGMCWLAKIMPVKVLSADGYGSYTNIAAGIRYAADHGAKIINLSLGGSNPSFILEDSCQYAFSKGSTLIAASGSNGGVVLYPAAYDNYCLAVAGTDADDARASFSNYGPQVDVAAPGAYIWGAKFIASDPANLNSYRWGNGTSFSTPYVSGAAALLLSYKPFLTNSQIMDLIRFTADDVNKTTYPGVDPYLGYGRLNLDTLLGPYQIPK